ncbi:MAG: hypothetical protein ACRELE_04990 [Gemmatimonadales bacterium]
MYNYLIDMKRTSLRLLAIDLTAKGFGFALLDRRRGLLDWGFCTVLAADDETFSARLHARIDRGQPTVLVVENFAVTKGRENALRRRDLIMKIATERQLGMCHVSRIIVRRILGVRTGAETARTLVDRFPELRSRMPAVRKPWTSEDERMHIFDALALALVVMSPDEANAAD